MMNQVPTLPALGERCSVLDTVSKRARTPLRSPICVHGQKCLLVDNARDEIASDMCESSVTSKSHGRVCKLIDLVLSSSIEDTVRVVDETDALRTLVFSTGPLNPFPTTEIRSDARGASVHRSRLSLGARGCPAPF